MTPARLLFLSGVLFLASSGCREYDPLYDVPCVDGMADEFACDNFDLAAQLPVDVLGGRRGSDIWGWTDPASGAELVVAGMTTGVSIVDATIPTAPTVLGFLPSPVGKNAWADIEVVDGFAYIVKDKADHGIQVLELAPLIGNARDELTADAHYTGVGNTHNLASLPEEQLVFALASDQCNEGIHALDVSSPLDPTFLSCWGEAGYVHDAHCVVYAGPDADHTGKRICVAFTPEDDTNVWILDYTDPTAPSVIASADYPDSIYSHQGWFTEDQRYVLMNDEYDESAGFNTRTMFFDLEDLDVPQYVGAFLDDTVSIGHDSYIKGDRIYQANYSDGLRVFDIVDPDAAELSLAGFFDTFPPNAKTNYKGAWGVYPYFPSGTIAVNSQHEGLFLLTPTMP